MYDKYAWSLLCPWAFFYKPGLNNWLPEILLSYGFSATAAGYWASVPSAIGIIGVLFIPRFASLERRNWVMGALFIAVLAASLLLQNSHPVFLGIGLTLQGLARGSMMTVAIMILMETPGDPEKNLGLAGGMFFTAAEIGGVLGPVTLGVLAYLTGGFSVPLLMISFVSIGIFAVLVALSRGSTLGSTA